jgi:tRNA wybutosine-synthesizing protein 2
MEAKRTNRNRLAYDAQSLVEEWLDSLPTEKTLRWERTGWLREGLLTAAPKRFTIYEPMVLLPTGTFASPPWLTAIDDTTNDERDRLWCAMLAAMSKSHNRRLTHLAVNGSIPLHFPPPSSPAVKQDEPGQARPTENILRSPLQLTPLFGSFGPLSPKSNNAPSCKDFDEAFWVSTKQNGILQTWAPRHTMFSRGNITEKARLLSFHSVANAGAAAAAPPAAAPRRARKEGSPPLKFQDKWAVDLYAGIGYFVFSYAKLGMRVLGWEVNPWSVEGLRRGAERNGWTVKVVAGEELEMPVADVVGDERIVIFLEDNRSALERIEALRRAKGKVDVLHVNGGLLPTSEERWRDAWAMERESEEGWLHLHENVGEDEIEGRRGEIERMFRTWSSDEGSDITAVVEHVEKVKTFAPRVWHCVFDVYITSIRASQT